MLCGERQGQDGTSPYLRALSEFLGEHVGRFANFLVSSWELLGAPWELSGTSWRVWGTPWQTPWEVLGHEEEDPASTLGVLKAGMSVWVTPKV